MHTIKRVAIMSALSIALSSAQTPNEEMLRSLRTQVVNDTAKKCRKRDFSQCYQLGMFYATGMMGIKRDAAKAAYYLSYACENGVAKACEALGDIYENGGERVRKNPQKALWFYSRSCERGEANACLDAADISYLRFKDNQKTFFYLSKACMLKSAEGCYEAGMFVEKFGERKDRAGAFYRRACKLGLNVACKKGD